ncbi:hypothetical protein AZI86_10365 [Bdellovibrio bacteriovorus]|uniref:Uncharacterized protein n=1 Tax=Bdellovibrio bacteriovorus TaxID=959 RepID=A0A150WSP6_BDEBC|nr:hypothetical protein [Bdellovibrio bacteriovorus]KYG67387.1 hypothetical protein AZI86_10365 [Bdellovibrio bacteriovorus]
MKNLILAAALTLSASTGWSVTGSFTCNNKKLETLEILENGPGAKVEASLYIFRNVENFQGLVVGEQYVMHPTADDQEVTLKVVKSTSFSPPCGRCPGGEFPPKPVKASYYAKLTVGNHVYDFVCNKKYTLP